MKKKLSKNKRLCLLDAAKVIGISRDGVYKAITVRKTLPAEKLGSQWTVLYTDALYYKKHRKGQPGRPKKENKS